MAKSKTEVAEQPTQSPASHTSLQPVEDLAAAVEDLASVCLDRLTNIADLLFGMLPDGTTCEARPQSCCWKERVTGSLDDTYNHLKQLAAVIDRFGG